MEFWNDILMEFASPLTWRLALARLGSALALSVFIALFHMRFSATRNGRQAFTFSLLMLGMTSSLLAGIIASSVALSIGMVGSISIIRFRTRVDHPQQLILVFLVMAAGLGIGLEKAMFSWVATLCILLLWSIKSLIEEKSGTPAVVQITSPDAKAVLAEIRNLKTEFRLTGFWSDGKTDKLKIEIDNASNTLPVLVSQSIQKIPGSFVEFEFTANEG